MDHTLAQIIDALTQSAAQNVQLQQRVAELEAKVAEFEAPKDDVTAP